MKTFIFLFAFTIFYSVQLEAGEIRVSLDGNHDFVTITDAMEAAQAGDIILVYEGTYDRLNNGEDFPIAFKEGVVLKWAEYGKMPVIDASGKPRSFDCYNISTGSNTKIEGMKIYGGEAIYSINYPQSFGGGMLLDNAEITISQCVFEGNDAGFGGAISIYECSPVIRACSFYGNWAKYGGGAIRIYKGSPLIEYCEFDNNTSGSDGSGYGGAIAVNTDSYPKIYISLFDDSRAGHGGALDVDGASLDLIGCLVKDSEANASGGKGGAMFLQKYEEETVNINNCSFMDNEAVDEGGALYIRDGDSSVLIRNCIVWSNSGTSIFLEDGPVDVRYSDIELDEGVYEGEGNINQDPLFEVTNDDAHLKNGSPCIDAGTPDTTGLKLLPLDLDKHVRIWDGNGDETARIDMGCYEYGAPIDIHEVPGDRQEDFVTIKTWPNPFSEGMNISLELKTSTHLTIQIVNLQGIMISKLGSSKMKPGLHEILWKPDGISSGIYFIYVSDGRNTIASQPLYYYK